MYLMRCALACILPNSLHALHAPFSTQNICLFFTQSEARFACIEKLEVAQGLTTLRRMARFGEILNFVRKVFIYWFAVCWFYDVSSFPKMRNVTQWFVVSCGFFMSEKSNVPIHGLKLHDMFCLVISDFNRHLLVVDPFLIGHEEI